MTNFIFLKRHIICCITAMKKHIILFLIICPLFGFGQANKLFRQATRTNDLSEKVSLLTKL